MKVEKTPAMPFYGNDMYMDESAASLSWAHQGLYVRLLWWQWREGSIPSDPEAIINVIGREREFKRLWPELVKFFASMDGRLQNARLEKVRKRHVKFLEIRSEAGRHGAENRWQNDDKADGKPYGEIITKPANGKGMALETETETESFFFRFWECLLNQKVPKPVRKSGARKAFESRIDSEDKFNRIKAARDNYAKSKRVESGFVQDAPTWIRDWEQWEIDPESTPVAVESPAHRGLKKDEISALQVGKSAVEWTDEDREILRQQQAEAAAKRAARQGAA